MGIWFFDTVRGLDYTFTIAFALGVRRLVSTPSLTGLARYWHFTAFTEFDAFYSDCFQSGTQIIYKSVVSTDSTIGAIIHVIRYLIVTVGVFSLKYPL